MNINDILKNRRLELELTMKQVADMVGVSEGTISRWESGDIANMRRDKIVALARALQVHPGVIMGWEEYTASYIPASDLALSEIEKALIIHYRSSDPGTQRAVRKLLDVEDKEEEKDEEYELGRRR